MVPAVRRARRRQFWDRCARNDPASWISARLPITLSIGPITRSRTEMDRARTWSPVPTASAATTWPKASSLSAALIPVHTHGLLWPSWISISLTQILPKPLMIPKIPVPPIPLSANFPVPPMPPRWAVTPVPPMPPAVLSYAADASGNAGAADTSGNPGPADANRTVTCAANPPGNARSRRCRR